jgi:hypothetical protein
MRVLYPPSPCRNRRQRAVSRATGQGSSRGWSRRARGRSPITDDHAHPLSACVGYDAFDPGGRIGVVAEVEYGTRRDVPDHLVIRRGMFRRRHVRVPAESVIDVDVERRRVVVHGAPVRRMRWRSPAEDVTPGKVPADPA